MAPIYSPTSEYRGTGPNVGMLWFTIKKHAAWRLHYDLRLELQGVLKSWVLVEGPSADPATVRRALLVDDHDLKYLRSERQIPEGEPGAGTVMHWDDGTWIPVRKDSLRAFQEGRLEFTLCGKRSHGLWTLLRTNEKEGRREVWLLIKGEDEYTQPGRPNALVDAHDVSIKTGRTMDEIRDGEPPKGQKGTSDDQLDLPPMSY